MEIKKIYQEIDEQNNFTPLFETLNKVSQLLVHEDIYPEMICQLVCSDPIISAKIVSVANSSYFRRNRDREINTLKEAITILGIKITLQLVFALCLKSDVFDNNTYSLFQDYYLTNSVLAASLASGMLGIKKTTAGERYLSALTQDIGMVALLSIFGDEYSDFILTTPFQESFLNIEKEKFNITHVDAGVHLFRRYNMPACLTTAIAESHLTPEKRELGMRSHLGYVNFVTSQAASNIVDPHCDIQNLENLISPVVADLFRQNIGLTMKAISTNSILHNIRIIDDERFNEISKYYSPNE